ncbi:MAG: tyrosine-type recombinase/integrase [Chromatiales bacterium]|nr:tyrosine-type recombinase/integrase [Chromatiales bacterium]
MPKRHSPAQNEPRAYAKWGGIHSLRHAYATHQLDNGLGVHILQRQLGSNSLSSTMRYIHWVPSYRDAGAQHCDLLSAWEPTS